MRAISLILTLALSVHGVVALAEDRPDLVGIPTVIDGDTLEIRGERIRLHGIDAPESSQLCMKNGAAYRCGQQAAFFLDGMINRKNVRCLVRDTDRYGRLVAVCKLGEQDLNEAMVAQGWALAYRQYGTDYVKAEDAAREQRAGLWAGTFENPWDYRANGKQGRSGGSAPRTYGGGAAMGDKDCKDFATQAEAQRFFLQAGPGDPHRLDRDRDGIACE